MLITNIIEDLKYKIPRNTKLAGFEKMQFRTTF